MTDKSHTSQSSSRLSGPPVNPKFRSSLDELVALAHQGQSSQSEVYNPSDDWLTTRMPILDDLPQEQQAKILEEVAELEKIAEEANSVGKAATRVWPEAVVRLDNGGLDFFSQLGVGRRPDLTQYFVDGFEANRDGIAFSSENQELFSEVFEYISAAMRTHFKDADTIIQTDRQVADAPGRSFHARQLLFGVRYLQLPYMWRQLTFDLPKSEYNNTPDIVEVTIPNWLEDLGLPDDLKAKINESGLTQLIFKAPTKGLSLHLGFDYAGEHKMGPLSIAMFLVKQNNGLAVQASLSVARAKTIEGQYKNTGMVTIGPSLHGKSTLTIMIELANSALGELLNLQPDSSEGVYPMNDDIVLLQPLSEPIETTRGENRIRISHGIDGTENNFYAVPFGLTREDDPITYDVVRGTIE